MFINQRQPLSLRDYDHDTRFGSDQHHKLLWLAPYNPSQAETKAVEVRGKHCLGIKSMLLEE